MTEVLGIVVKVYLSPVSTASVLGRQFTVTPRGTSNVLWLCRTVALVMLTFRRERPGTEPSPAAPISEPTLDDMLPWS